jgi:hypothetical protein
MLIRKLGRRAISREVNVRKIRYVIAPPARALFRGLAWPVPSEEPAGDWPGDNGISPRTVGVGAFKGIPRTADATGGAAMSLVFSTEALPTSRVGLPPHGTGHRVPLSCYLAGFLGGSNANSWSSIRALTTASYVVVCLVWTAWTVIKRSILFTRKVL